MPHERSVAEKLCLTCGLCCNGVIFADVQLQCGDNDERLKALGLPLARFRKGQSEKGTAAQWKFPQPCAAFDGCHCRIYEERPKHCRAFDCALLKNVKEGEIKVSVALRQIEKARARAEKVRQLLRRLDDNDEHLALGLRFQRTLRRLEQSNVDSQTAGVFSELTLGMHELNLLLGQSFYPNSYS